MRVALQWLSEYTSVSLNSCLDHLLYVLNSIGLEVEKIIDWPLLLSSFRVALIEEAFQHPNANGLRVCKVFDGEKSLQVICGAANARAGIKVVLAPIGVNVGNLCIAEREIRGQKSYGMLCSAAELGISEESSGIIELPENAVVGSNPAVSLGLDDIILDIAVTPNMARVLNIRGLAREIGCFSNVIGFVDKSISVVNSIEPCPYDFRIESGCTFASGIHIIGIDNKRPLPQYILTRLDAVGVRSVSPVVDIVNYCTHEIGSPLHAYDAKALNGGLLTIKDNDQTNSGNKYKMLNNKDYQVDTGALVVRDANDIIALAGVMGCADSSCKENTTDIFIESALFLPEKVANTAKKLNIDSQASYRFERGIDPECCLKTLNMATNMIIELCGGRCSKITTTGQLPTVPRVIDLDIAYLNKISGRCFTNQRVQEILARFSISCSEELSCTLPSFLHDFTHQADLVEEILKYDGYKLTAKSYGPILTHVNNRRYVDKSSLVRAAWAGMGYVDTMSWSFISKEKALLFADESDLLHISNPMSEEMAVLRTSILPGLLDAVVKNVNRGAEGLMFFELGRVYTRSRDTKLALVALRFGMFNARNMFAAQRPSDIFDMKAELMIFLSNVFGFQVSEHNLDWRAGEAPGYYHPWRSAGVYYDGNRLGFCGELNPDLCEAFSLKGSAIALEIDYQSLVDLAPLKDCCAISKFPKVTRDFAFILPKNVEIATIIKAIKGISDSLIRNVVVFDVFSDNKFGPDHRSVAFSVILQANDRTLNDLEITALSDRVIDSLTNKLGGRLRGPE